MPLRPRFRWCKTLFHDVVTWTGTYVKLRNSVPLSLCTMLHRCFDSMRSNASLTSRPVFVLNGMDQARFVNTSIQFSRYSSHCTSRGSTDPPDRFEIGRQYPSNTFDDAETVLCRVYASCPARESTTALRDLRAYRRNAWTPPKLPGARGFT